MKGSTYYWMENGPNGKQKGFDALRRITQEDSNPKLTFFGKNDDLYIINLALERNAWIVTQDTFEDRWNKEKGEAIPKERTLYPTLPWDKIDDGTWGTELKGSRVRPNDVWHTDGPYFFHPTLRHAPGFSLKDENSELRDLLEDLEDILDEIDQSAENHSKPESEHVCEIRRHVGWIHVRFRQMLELLPKTGIPPEDKLRSMTVEVLKDLCRILGLKVSGRKEELVKRITECGAERAKREAKKIEKKPTKKATKKVTKKVSNNRSKQKKAVAKKSEAPPLRGLVSEVEHEKALKTDEKETTDMLVKRMGFTKEDFAGALLRCKQKIERETYAVLYGRLIKESQRFDLKKHEIKPNWYLEQCSEFIDFEIRQSGAHKHYWI